MLNLPNLLTTVQPHGFLAFFSVPCYCFSKSQLCLCTSHSNTRAVHTPHTRNEWTVKYIKCNMAVRTEMHVTIQRCRWNMQAIWIGELEVDWLSWSLWEFTFWPAGILATGQVDVEVMRKTQSGIFFDNLSHYDDLFWPGGQNATDDANPRLDEIKVQQFRESTGILYRIHKNSSSEFQKLQERRPVALTIREPVICPLFLV